MQLFSGGYSAGESTRLESVPETMHNLIIRPSRESTSLSLSLSLLLSLSPSFYLTRVV